MQRLDVVYEEKLIETSSVKVGSLSFMTLWIVPLQIPHGGYQLSKYWAAKNK
jgi:hypothetical protein